MITYRLQGFGISEETLWTCAGELYRVKSGERASYMCRLFGSNDQLLGEAMLTEYPRWVERVGLLVARAIDVVLQSTEEPVENLEASKEVITVWLNSERLMTLEYTKSGRKLYLSSSREFVLHRKCGGWQLAQKVLCANETGAFRLPAVPAPLRPPVYSHEEVRYCRSSDLPPEVRAAFEWNRRYSTSPVILGVPDAYYEHDLMNFIVG